MHQRMRSVVKVFLERRLIPESAMTRFDAAIASAFRLRNSVLGRGAADRLRVCRRCLIVWRQYMALDAATWYATPSVSGSKLSLAGRWYGYVSLPFFQFLLCRWYFRLFIWMRFLWQVSRIELNLIPTHPDRVGGLGFLCQHVYAFAPLAVAHGAILAGPLANRILYLGAALTEYKIEIAVVVVFCCAWYLARSWCLRLSLPHAKRTGLREYGTLADVTCASSMPMAARRSACR